MSTVPRIDPGEPLRVTLQHVADRLNELARSVDALSGRVETIEQTAMLELAALSRYVQRGPLLPPLPVVRELRSNPVRALAERWTGKAVWWVVSLLLAGGAAVGAEHAARALLGVR